MIFDKYSIRIPPEELFFTADHHFGHANILKHCNRPFPDLETMHRDLIALWNAKVPKNAQVVILGDMFWKRNEEYAAIMQALNGTKHMLLGSHDSMKAEEYEALGFASLGRFLKVKSADERMICSHCPFLEWEGYWRGTWHLHGHTHGRLRHPSVRAMDVGVDPNNYMPVSFFEVRDRLKEAGAKEMVLLQERERHDPIGARNTK